MSDRTPREGHQELAERLKALTQSLPSDLELRRLLLNLDDPANDEMSKDRYAALIAGGAVDECLGTAIERQTPKAPKFFGERISCAKKLGIITDGQSIEIEKIKLIRNAFAHSLHPIGFGDETISEATKGLWDHPVTSWAGYYAPRFTPRHQYAIVCSEFCDLLLRAPDP